MEWEGSTQDNLGSGGSVDSIFSKGDLWKMGVWENSLFQALENIAMKSVNFQVDFLLFFPGV